MMAGLACTAAGKFERAVTRLTAAHELLQSECPGQPWLLTSTRMYLGLTWTILGDFASLAHVGTPWLEEA